VIVPGCHASAKEKSLDEKHSYQQFGAPWLSSPEQVPAQNLHHPHFRW